MSIEPTPRYTWRLTWPEVQDDFVGSDGVRKFGRIHKHHMRNWSWFLTMKQAFYDRPAMGTTSGAAETARLAAAAVEVCYDRVMAGEWPGMSERDKALVVRLRESGQEFVSPPG
ncbi:MAG: hypothetical protein ACK4M8_05430 [Allorhizobium sp.]